MQNSGLALPSAAKESWSEHSLTTGGVVAGDRTAAVAPVVVVAGADVVVEAAVVVVAGTDVVVLIVVLVDLDVDVVDGDEEGVEPHTLRASIAGTTNNPASNPRLSGPSFSGRAESLPLVAS